MISFKKKKKKKKLYQVFGIWVDTNVHAHVRKQIYSQSRILAL